MSKSEKKDKEKILPKDSGETKNIEKVKEDTVEEKLKKTHEKLLRTMAEMENQRRRFEKEIRESAEFGGFNFAKESLSLLDNIDRASISFRNDEKLKNNKDINKIIDGIEIVKKDLTSIFEKNGIKQIDCINKKFDPNFHQAMFEVEDNSKEAGIVTQEIQKGYMMKDRLLRPSLVGVTKKKEENTEKVENYEKKTDKKG